MLIIFFRTIILYLALVVIMRLMGKRQIGEMQPFEFVITLLIAELVCIPMTDVSIPLSYGLVAVLAVFILHQIMSLMERLGNKVKFCISGRPSVVVTPDRVCISELRANNMGVEDLIEAMRCLGYLSPDQLNYAIFESNGKLSAFEKENVDNPPDSIPYLLICEGKCKKSNFKFFNLDFNDFNRLIDNKINKLSSVEIATIDKSGRVFLQQKGEKYSILKINLGSESDNNKMGKVNIDCGKTTALKTASDNGKRL